MKTSTLPTFGEGRALAAAEKLRAMVTAAVTRAAAVTREAGVTQGAAVTGRLP
jgi:hypothetical protein